MYSIINRSLLSLLGAVTLVFLLASSQTAFSQTTKSEEILQGRVADSAGAALPASSVTLSNLSTGLERVAITDASGSFIFKIVRGGSYRLIASANGFAPDSGTVSKAAPMSTRGAKRLYVFFDSGDLLALNHKSNMQLQRKLADEYDGYKTNHELGSSLAMTGKAVALLIIHSGTGSALVEKTPPPHA